MALSRCWQLLLAALCLFAACAPITPAHAADGDYERALRTSSPARESDPIPRLVHYVYGLRSGTPGFDFFQYLSVKSAHENIKPDAIWLWVHNEPEGEWWEKAKALVTLKHIDAVDSVYGIPVAHFAHRADILRLKVLHDHGGIYLDLDVLALKSFDELLIDNSFVMGQEGANGAIGLCNAVIISQPRAPFLRRWMESYRTFDGIVWAWHSVAVPGHLSAVYPDEITVLNHTAFFWPLWNEVGLQKLYMEKSHDFSQSYAVHLWESNARHWFLNQLTPDLVANIDLPLMCEIRRIMGTLSPDDTTANCEPAKRNFYSDGTVALYTFDKDNITTRRIEDDLGNQLHGWALNGTELVPGRYERGQARYFRGMGDFGILPVPNTMSLGEFSVQADLRFGDLCQSAGSILAVQSKDITILLEGTCNPPKRTLWLKAFHTRQSEESIVPLEADTWPSFNEGEWVTVTIRASATARKLELLIDNQITIAGPWPPPGREAKHRTAISNVWLGARPASPFPKPHRQEIMNDFRGAIDNVIVWDRFMPQETLGEAAQDAHAYFHRHRELALARQSSILVANVDMTSHVKQPTSAITWVNDSTVFAPTYPNNLPINMRDALPLNSLAWTISWTMNYVDPFVPERVVRGKTIPEEPYLNIKFDSGQSLAVTHDVATGNLLIKQWGFGYPSILPVSRQSACHRSVGCGIAVHLSLSLDTESGDVALYCAGVRIFVRRLERTIIARGARIDSVSPSSPPVRIQMQPSISDEATRIALADSMLERKPALIARVAGQKITLPSNSPRTGLVTLPNETFVQNDLRISLEPSIQLDRLSATLYMSLNQSAYFVGVPLVQVIQEGENKYTLSSPHLVCAGRPTARVEMALPELFARFTWDIHCRAPEDSALHEDLTAWVEASVKQHPLQYLLYFVVIASLLGSASLWRKQKSSNSAALASSEKPTVSQGQALSAGLSQRSKAISLLGVATAAYLIIRYTWLSSPDSNTFGANTSQALALRTPEAQRATLARDQHITPHQRDALALADNSTFHDALYRGHNNQPIAFSIITPCYMQSQYIADAGRSLSEQTFPHFEWLIVDDGSPDQCYLVAQQLRDMYRTAPIRVIRKPNSGLADTRNAAIQAAQSDWICLLDADDRLDPTYLEKAAEAIHNQRRLTAVNSNQQFFGDSEWLWDLPDFSKTLMLYKGIFPVQTIFRRQDWARVGGFEPTLPWGNEDWAFWVGLSHLNDFDIKKLPGNLLKYRYKEESMQREKQLYPEVYWMMMTLHWDKYTPNEIKLAHELIGRWAAPETVELVKKMSAKFPSRRAPHLWLGIFAEERSDLVEAAMHYTRSLESRTEEQKDWQAEYRLSIIARKQKTPNAYLGM